MKLSDLEKRMLDGVDGEAKRMAMEILVKLGTIYEADKLVPIQSAHVLAVYPHLEASPAIMEKFADAGGKFCVPTTVDPGHNEKNFDKWPEFKEPEELKSKSIRLSKAVESMGCIPNWSCTPYYQGNLPRKGEFIAWTESSAISFANSVLGARTNRTTMGVDLASAISGYTPHFGLLLDENRVGNVSIKLETPPRTMYDYNLLGYMIGKKFSDKIPVIDGLPPTTTCNNLKALGAAAASSGVIPLYHALGLTPEAPTREIAFGGKNPGKKEIDEAKIDISTFEKGDIDAVLIGCPHPTIGELGELTKLVQGRKVKKRIKFCLFASADVVQIAKKMGMVEVFEQSGIDIFEGDCVLFCPARTWGWKNVATNSAKYANLLPSDPTYFKVLFTDLKGCVKVGTD
ncbi:aconitase X catalytic domain-containing protein [bacterium]|nr:aconitase X catalytic domain-containing protein [bacterium]